MKSCIQKWHSGSVNVDCTTLDKEPDVRFDLNDDLTEVIHKIELAISNQKVVIRNCLCVTVEFNGTIKRNYTAYNLPGNDLTEHDKEYMAIYVITDLMILLNGSAQTDSSIKVLSLREELFNDLNKSKV